MKSVRYLAVLGLVAGLYGSVSSEAHAQVAATSPYNVAVSSSFSGDFDAVLGFGQLNIAGLPFGPYTANGTWGLVAEDGSVGQGLYTEAGFRFFGLFTTSTVDATGGNDQGYVGAFTADYSDNSTPLAPLISIIFGVPVGTSLVGEGAGNAGHHGDTFTFSN